MAETKETAGIAALKAKIAELENLVEAYRKKEKELNDSRAEMSAENDEIKALIKEMQDKLEAKAHQAATGNPTFLVEGQKIEMLAKRVRLNFEHKENGIEKKPGDTVNAEELEKMPALIQKLLNKKIGVLVVK